MTKGKKKKPKNTLKHEPNLDVRPRFFMAPSHLFGTALTCQLRTRSVPVVDGGPLLSDE
jgi:hypothetical protein